MDEQEQLEEQEEIEEQEQQEQEQQEAQEQAELEAQMAEQNKLKQEENALKLKLNTIAGRIMASGETKLTSGDNDTIKKARKHKPLGAQIAKIYGIIAFNAIKKAVKKAIQFVAKLASSGPVGFWAVIIGAILLIAICVFASIYIALSADGTSSSPFGVTGKDFYGVRMVYENQEKATTKIIEDYVEIIEDGIQEATSITTVSKDGEDYDVQVSVNIALPQNYDYNNFNEESFQLQYPQTYALVFDIAKLVYKFDNQAETTATKLVECVDGILYFGYGQTVMADVSKLLNEQIVANTVFTSEDDTENVLTKADVQAVVSSELATLYSSEKYGIRTEKLFFKDYILQDADEKLSGVTEENYVAMLFMPKKDVTFNKFSFSVSGKNLSDISLSLKNNGSEIILTKDDIDYSIDDGETQRYLYFSNSNLDLRVNAFEEIDEDNLEMFNKETSLFDVAESVVNYADYLEQNSTQVYTLKQNGVVLNVSCSQPFTVIDYETSWVAI